MNRRFCRLLVALLLASLAGLAEEPSHFAIRNARIVPVSGPAIENGTVVIHNGLITAVGTSVSIPTAALVIDGKGLTVYPGLLDALSTLGLPEASSTAAGRPTFPTAGPAPSPAPSGETQRAAQGPEDRPATTPWVHAADLVSPSDRRIEAARNAGFTSALVAPQRGIFPGFAALINLAGDRAGEMVVKTPVALHVTFSSGGAGGFRSYPGSLMGVLSYVKQTLMDARHYRQAWAAYNGGTRGRRRPEYDRALEYLEPVVAGRVPVFLPADTEVQIRRYLDLGEELGARFLLYGAHEGYRVAPLLAEHKAAVLVSARWPERDRDADPEREDSLRTLRLRDRASSTPAALHKAGVRFAFYSDGTSNPRDVLRNVKKAVDAGLPADAALRALTLSPAEILGVDDVLGSIEPGKVANLVVADGDLFAERTRIRYVFVDGRKFNVPEEEARPQQPGAVNVTGIWNLKVDAPEEPMSVTAYLRQEGSQVSGELQTSVGPGVVMEGSVSGNELRLRVRYTIEARSTPQRRFGVEATLRGTISGSEIKGTLTTATGVAMNFSGSKPQEHDDQSEEG